MVRFVGRKSELGQLQSDLANIQNSKSYAEAGSSYALLASKYADILSNDEKKQLMDASNQAWSKNATATAPTTVTASYASVALAGPPKKEDGPIGSKEGKKDGGILSWVGNFLMNSFPGINLYISEESDEDPNDPRSDNRIISKDLDKPDNIGGFLVDVSETMDDVSEGSTGPFVVAATADSVAKINSVAGILAKLSEAADNFFDKATKTAAIVKLGADIGQVSYGYTKGKLEQNPNTFDRQKTVTLISEDLEGIGELVIEAMAWKEGAAGLACYAGAGASIPFVVIDPDLIDIPGFPKMAVRTIINGENGQSIAL